ncbi:MAG: DUF2461 domain-containing protein [Planctomycetaceae bacterium]|jgi:uncharacterized protein (TIGR02453 family)|nr:DUF2461 domain-containing protein [Planctomycetaceae bacterium]
MTSKKVYFNDDLLFSGFSRSAIKFFRELGRNNNRDWFLLNRERYIRFVFEPMKCLVGSISPVISGLDPLALTIPSRVISRIYRDVRFSSDRLPYRARIWFAFKRDVEYWSSTPAYFFQFDDVGYVYGMGMYSALPLTMKKFRGAIDDDPKGFSKIIEPIEWSEDLRLESDIYKRRIPSEYPLMIDNWYQSRSIAVLGRREPDEVFFSSSLIDFLTERFILLKPLYDFLWSVTVLK